MSTSQHRPPSRSATARAYFISERRRTSLHNFDDITQAKYFVPHYSGATKPNMDPATPQSQFESNHCIDDMTVNDLDGPISAVTPAMPSMYAVMPQYQAEYEQDGANDRAVNGVPSPHPPESPTLLVKSLASEGIDGAEQSGDILLETMTLRVQINTLKHRLAALQPFGFAVESMQSHVDIASRRFDRLLDDMASEGRDVMEEVDKVLAETDVGSDPGGFGAENDEEKRQHVDCLLLELQALTPKIEKLKDRLRALERLLPYCCMFTFMPWIPLLLHFDPETAQDVLRVCTAIIAPVGLGVWLSQRRVEKAEKRAKEVRGNVARELEMWEKESRREAEEWMREEKEWDLEDEGWKEQKVFEMSDPEDESEWETESGSESE